MASLLGIDLIKRQGCPDVLASWKLTVRIAGADSERATSAINPTGASRGGPGLVRALKITLAEFLARQPRRWDTANFNTKGRPGPVPASSFPV